MKTLLTLLSLCICLSADAASFYQYQRFTTNTDGHLINGNTLTNIYGTNLVVGTVNSNSFDTATLALFGAGGGYAGPTTITSNYVSGQVYTNLSGRPEFVSCPVVVTIFNVSGVSLVELIVDTAGGVNFNQFSASSYCGETTTTSNAIFNLNGTLTAYIPPGASYVITNLSSGTGNAVSLPNKRTLTQF